MKRLAIVLVAAACKTEVPASLTSDHEASALPSVVESPSAPTNAASVAASAMAPSPASSVACRADDDCVAIPSACCGSWPSNVASRAEVQRAVAASDAARDNCKNRVCAMRMQSAACERARCVVR